MKGPDQQEIIRLGPWLAHKVREKGSFIRELIKLLDDDDSISSSARNKLQVMNSLVGDVAQYARQFHIITDSQDKIPIDTRSSIIDYAPLFRRLLEGYSLQIDVDDNVWPVAADYVGQVEEEILLILVVNARNSARDRDSIRIRARNAVKAEVRTKASDIDCAGDFVVIEVSNHGAGLAKAILNRIFEPFFPTEGKLDNLALASVDFVIRKLEGHIWVDSEVGKGLTFKVLLPTYRLI
jgi:signal transduction histidine kinase